MGFSDEDKILIKNLHDSKEYGHKRLMKELTEKVGAKLDCHGASCLPETNLHCG